MSENPFAPRSRAVPERLQNIKAWTRSAYGLDDGVTISVAEIACREEGCPDIETVIGIMRPGERIETIRLHKPLIDVSIEDIARGGETR